MGSSVLGRSRPDRRLARFRNWQLIALVSYMPRREFDTKFPSFGRRRVHATSMRSVCSPKPKNREHSAIVPKTSTNPIYSEASARAIKGVALVLMAARGGNSDISNYKYRTASAVVVECMRCPVQERSIGQRESLRNAYRTKHPNSTCT
jgi:hypothetical protein